MSHLHVFILILIYVAIYVVIGYQFFSIYHEKIWFVLMIIPLIAIPIWGQINPLLWLPILKLWCL